MRLIQTKFRIGNLAVDKHGFEVDWERAVLPSIVYAGRKDGRDRVTVLGIGWWKWGCRVTVHTRSR